MPCQDNLDVVERNYIVETVKSIDRMQKDIVLDRISDCITCETSLITMAYNTVPVIFYLCDGDAFTCFTDNTLTTSASLFRIECLRENRFVTLRLLTTAAGALTCTNQTCILDLNCACGIECLEPVNCTECQQNA